MEERRAACKRRAGEGGASVDSEARPGQHPLLLPPAPGRLTLVTVAPGKARAAPPLQRRHCAVGHSVRGSDQSPVTNTRAESGQCEHLPAHSRSHSC